MPYSSIAPCGTDLLIQWAGKDASEMFQRSTHSPAALSLMQNFCVGSLDEETPVQREKIDKNRIESLYNAMARQRHRSKHQQKHFVNNVFCSFRDCAFSLAVLIGLNCHKLVVAYNFISQENRFPWVSANFLKGGLKV